MSDNFNVVACSNPFKSEQTNLTMAEGTTIAAMMLEVQPDPILASYAHIYIDDLYVLPEEWALTTPTAGQLVTVRVVPHGGGGKNPLATVLTIAVMAVAVAYGGPAGAALLDGVVSEAVGTAIGTMAVGMVGSLLVNAIAPPPSQKAGSLSASDAATLSISGARNQSGALHSIPKILGEHLVTPYYGALPYTELRGTDQYLHMLFVLGYGPLEISDHKIGETDLNSYDDYEIEVRYGYDDDPPMSLYPSTVIESAVGTTLAETTGWVYQTTTANIQEFNVEIAFLQGLVRFSDSGNKHGVRVNFEVEYSLTGANSWTQVSPVVNFSGTTFEAGRGPGVRYQPDGNEDDVYHRTTLIYVNKATSRIGSISNTEVNATASLPATPKNSYAVASYTQVGYASTVASLQDRRDSALTLSGSGNFAATATGGRDIAIAAGDFLSAVSTSIYAKTTAAVRHGVTAHVPEGQYDVRVRRVTADSNDDQYFDTATWSIIRSIDNTDPIAMSGLAKVALVIKATDQLNGIIDQYNCVAKSVFLDWVGTGWIEQPTSNPAAIYRSIFQAAGMKEPIADSRINLVELEDWAEDCARKDYEYNAVITEPSTPFEVARNVAAVGRASFAMKDGLYSVVRDSEATITAGPKQWLTPRNTWDVKGDKTFDAIHGLEVSYVDAEAGYRPEQIIAYVDGYDEATATRVDEMKLLGITHHDQAYKQAWYYLAVAALRPEMHSRMVDVEHLVCSRGDLIRVTDDVALHGIMSGRIRSVSGTAGDVDTIVVDEVAVMETGKTYAIRIRYADGSGDVYRAVNTVAGETDTFVLSTSIDAVDAPEVGDLVMFGETDQVTSDKIVHHIEMSSDLSARIFYVDAAPEVHTADAGSIPTYDPGITVTTDLQRIAPEVPQIVNISSDETAAAVQEDGSFRSQIMLSVAATSGTAQVAYFDCQYKESAADVPWALLPHSTAGDGTFYITDVVKGLEYAVRVRSVSSYGMTSDWVSVLHTVVGKTESLIPVTTLIVENSTGDDITFVEADCHIVWTNDPVLWNDWRWVDYYLVEILDKDTSVVLHTERVKTTRFDLTFEKNQAITGGPYREFKVRVTVHDVFEAGSTPVTIQPVNVQAPQVSGITATEAYGAATIFWPNSQEIALAGYEVHVGSTVGFTPSGSTLYATVGANTSHITIDKQVDATYFVKVGAFDVFTALGSYDLNYSLGFSVNIESVISTTDLADFAEELSNQYMIPVIPDGVFSVDAGTFSWIAHTFWYGGVEYSINFGETTDKYIWWDGTTGTTYLHTNSVADFQALDTAAPNHDWQIAINYGTYFELGFQSAANMVLGTARIGEAEIQNANIGDIIESTNFEWTPESAPGAGDGSATGWQLNKAGGLVGRSLQMLNADGGVFLQAGDPMAPPDADKTSENIALNTLSVGGTAADQVEANAFNAVTAVTNMESDSIFSVQEKTTWRVQWEGMQANYTNIIAQATAYGIEDEPSSVFAAFTTDRNTLYDYLNITHDIWATSPPPVDTTIIGTSLVDATTDFYDSMQLSINRLAVYTPLADVEGAGDLAGQDNVDLSTSDVTGTLPVAHTEADVTAASDFVTVTYPADQTDLQNQIDGKVESWFTSTDPSSTWTGSDADHTGDLWWNTSTNKLKNWSGTAWSADMTDQTAIDAYSDAAAAQSTADGKITIFSSTPSNYDIGDLYDDDSGSVRVLKKATTARATYNSADWVVVANEVLATSELTDDANLGETALWSNVSNTTDAPDDNADVTATVLPTVLGNELVLDSDMEDLSMDYWVGGGGKSTTQVKFGSQALRVTAVASSNGSVYQKSNAGGDNYLYIPVEPGQSIFISGWVYSEIGSGTGTARVGLMYSDEAKGAHNWEFIYCSTANAWEYIESTFTVPAGKYWISVNVGAGTSNTGGYAYFDRISCRRSVEGADVTSSQLAGNGVNLVSAVHYVEKLSTLSADNFYYNASYGTPIVSATTDKAGLNSLRLQSTALNNYITFAPSAGGHNIVIKPNSKWIMSAVLRLSSAGSPSTSSNVSFRLVASDATVYEVFLSVPADDNFHRHSVVLDLSPNASELCLMRIDNESWTDNGYTYLYIQSLMLEEQIGDLTTPSPYVVPSGMDALAEQITYADGSTIEDLQPAAAGADVTEDNESASVAGQEIYRYYGTLYNFASPATTNHLTNELGVEISGFDNDPRSYVVSVYDRSSRSWDSHTLYDVYGDSSNALTMADDLNALTDSKLVVITGQHAPASHRTTNGLPAAIYRCGGSATVFENEDWSVSHPCYFLAGIPGQGAGGGMELFAPGDIGFLDVTFVIKNGNLISSTQTPDFTPGADITGDEVGTISPTTFPTALQNVNTTWDNVKGTPDAPDSNAQTNVGANLVVNGDFRAGLVNTDETDNLGGWDYTGYAGVTYARIWPTTDGYEPPWGSVGEHVYYGKPATSSQNVSFLANKMIPIDDSKTYCLAGWAKGTTVNFYLRMRIYDGAKSSLLGYASAASGGSLTSSYVEYTETVGPNGDVAWPAGSRYVQVQCYPSYQDDGYGMVSRISFNEGLYPAPWGGADPGADRTESALTDDVEISSGGLKVVNSGSGTAVNITGGDIIFTYANNDFYALKRVEADWASSGDAVAFSPHFKTAPKVICSTRNIRSWDKDVTSSYNQAIVLEAQNVSTTGFTAVAKLAQGGAETGSSTRHDDDDPAYYTIGYTDITRVTVKLTNKKVCSTCACNGEDCYNCDDSGETHRGTAIVYLRDEDASSGDPYYDYVQKWSGTVSSDEYSITMDNLPAGHYRVKVDFGTPASCVAGSSDPCCTTNWYRELYKVYWTRTGQTVIVTGDMNWIAIEE